jgi:hypothetical protein
MDTRKASRHKQRIVWVCVILAFLLLLALTPPLLNVSRLQRRIAASMSASLGRTVHLDSAKLHILPVPGFTLQNLVVSEDPGFGSEPVIRANTVEVTLRPSSLWRRHVEFSSIKFVDPSLNLVRNEQGAWNIQSLLMHAANVETAPTAQRKAGPEPRFPKVGEEKKPFSLTETEFALWLPSPQVWRVRLEGKPTRTDTNITDAGVIRLEGTLERAATMADVPVDIAVSWNDSPLGEASRLLSGDDAGWRGNLAVNTTLVGTLSRAKLTTKVHVTELRRSDFIPVLSMDLQMECAGTLDVATAKVLDPDCSVSTPTADGSKTPGRVAVLADSADLSNLETVGLHAGMTGISNAWLLDWARLFTPRIPPAERPGGTIAGTIALESAATGATARWQGELHGDLTGMIPWKAPKAGPLAHPILIATEPPASPKNARASEPEGDRNGNEFYLAPMTLTPAGNSPSLTLSGTASRQNYTLQLVGSATEGQIRALCAMLPPLGDGLEEALPTKAGANAANPNKQMALDVSCTRRWGGPQICTEAIPAPPRKKHRAR